MTSKMAGAGEAGGMSEAKVSAGTSDRHHETISEENTATQAPGGGTQAANCGAPERTSPTSWRSHVTEYANILWQHRYVSTESEKCPVERPMTGQNTHFEQLIR